MTRIVVAGLLAGLLGTSGAPGPRTGASVTVPGYATGCVVLNRKEARRLGARRRYRLVSIVTCVSRLGPREVVAFGIDKKGRVRCLDSAELAPGSEEVGLSLCGARF